MYIHQEEEEDEEVEEEDTLGGQGERGESDTKVSIKRKLLLRVYDEKDERRTRG